MPRGNRCDAVFETDDDRRAFLSRPGEVCASQGWRVHARVSMSNHFHPLLETPQANGVTGMKGLPGTFSQGWNRARRRHVFQGRYHLWKESLKDRVDFLLGGHRCRVPIRDEWLQRVGEVEGLHGS
jgi:REP element-mobilizing transposase RayT